jgi:HTH-type transcriptional regulator / antitoxin MqsA
MQEKRFCLQCDDGTQIAHDTKDLVISLGKLISTVPLVSGWFCPVCSECQFDTGEGQRYGKALEALRLLANQQRAAAMRSTRKKLGLRQTEAGHLFGGGASAFSEYERGKTQPHKSTVLLLKLLDNHPELLPELLAA